MSVINVDGIKFQCPPELVESSQAILQGSLDVPVLPGMEPVRKVVDIGGGCGAFAHFAVRRWPGCVVASFEAHPVLYSCAENNAAHSISTHRGAVLPPLAERVSAKVIGRGDEEIEVSTISMGSLPQCDLLRVAAPGFDAQDILSAELTPEILIWESHMDQQDLGTSFSQLHEVGFRLIRGVQRRMDRGMWIFARTRARFDVLRNSYTLPETP